MILLDTQVVVWLVRHPDRLSRRAEKVIAREARRAGLAIASVTLFELAQMAARGAVRISATPSAWIHHVVSQSGLAVKELTVDVAAVAAFLPPTFPPDPVDRVIAATAIVERVPLVTADVRIQRSGVVPTVW